MSQLIAGMRCFSAEFAYNTGDVTVVIPDGWRIKDVDMEIETEFGDVMTATVGITGNTDAFLADGDVGSGAVGNYRMANGSAELKGGYTLGVGEDVVIHVTPGAAVAGAGKVFVYAHPSV